MSSAHQTQRPYNWTTQALLRWTTDYLTKKQVASPRLATEMLLAHILGTDRLRLYMDPDRPASELERAAFRDLVERAARHEPVQYLVGQCPFFSLMLQVSPDTLIPRPSTETLVEHVIQHARCTPGFGQALIADIGTGSGAIAIALAKHMPDCRVIATDLSDKALAVAKANAQKHDVDQRIEFRQGHLLEPLQGQRLHYLVSNPPYIRDSEWQDVAANVKNYEPVTALRAGPDGLDCLRPLICQSRGLLRHPGQLILEIADSQAEQVLALTHDQHVWNNAHVLADHESLPRVLVCDTEE